MFLKEKKEHRHIHAQKENNVETHTGRVLCDDGGRDRMTFLQTRNAKGYWQPPEATKRQKKKIFT